MTYATACRLIRARQTVKRQMWLARAAVIREQLVAMRQTWTEAELREAYGK